MSDIGKLWVQIVPSAQGFGAELSNIVTPAADTAGEDAGSSIVSKIAAGLAGGAAVLTAALGAAVGAAVKGATEFAAYGDNIDKMSQKMGLSAEAYQEWDAVMQHSGTSMETMKSSMKTLANAAEKGNDAFSRIGLSMADVQSMSQEDLFEATIAGLQNVEDSTERTYLAGQLLGRGATELGALLNTSAEDTQAMRDRVHELGGVLSDDAVKAAAAFQDNLQDMQTAMDGFKRDIAAQFLPGITEIMGGITGLLAGDEGAGAQLKNGINNLIMTAIESIPEIASAALSIAQAFIGAIVEIVPELAAKGYDMVTQLGTGILENLPSLITMGFTLLSNLVAGIMQNLPSIATAGWTLIGRFAMGIISNIPSIIGAIAQGIFKLVATIVSNAPTFLAQGVMLLGKLALGIIQSIPKVVATVPQIFSKVKSAFASINWLSIGTNIINGIARGISNGAKTVVNAAKNLAKNAFNAAKDFLGIQSPSKKFRWLADMSVEGYVLNLQDGIKPITQTVRTVMDEAVGVGSDAVRTYSGTAAQAYAPALEGAGGMYSFNIPLVVNGRQIARATAVYTQEELDKLNTQQLRREGVR